MLEPTRMERPTDLMQMVQRSDTLLIEHAPTISMRETNGAELPGPNDKGPTGQDTEKNQDRIDRTGPDDPPHRAVREVLDGLTKKTIIRSAREALREGLDKADAAPAGREKSDGAVGRAFSDRKR
jgi:hypothetical protein